MRVVVCGLGKVGKPLAEFMYSIGHTVTGLEVNPQLLTALPPSMGKITADPQVAYRDCEAALLIVPTPQEGDRLSSECVRKAGEQARLFMPSASTLFIVSTLDPRDAADLCESLGAIYTPVFIKLGSVLQDLQRQEYLLVGAPAHVPYSTAEGVSRKIWGWDDPNRVRTAGPVVVADPTTIACAKLAINATLSMRTAWANDVAMRAEHFGADPKTVCRVIGLDSRIGPAQHAAGWPPSGPCLPRDLVTWTAVTGLGVAEAAALAHRSVRRKILGEIHERVSHICSMKTPQVSSLRIMVVGLTYKTGALDFTDALGFTVATELARRGHAVFTYDRELTSPAMMAEHGVHQIQDGGAYPADLDVFLIGFPGYPEEITRAYGTTHPDVVVINPWV